MMLGHDDNGGLVGVTEFDYDILDRNLFEGHPHEAEFGREDVIEASGKLFKRIIAWVWQDGMKNTDGLKIRAAIVCWAFLPELRPLNLSQLAAGFGLHKQSIGRWVDDFKVQFEDVRTPHMRS